MTEDQFTKLFKHMQQEFDKVHAKLDEKASQASVDRLTNVVDSLVKRLDTSEIEQASKDRQFDRVVAWARDVSAKTGIPLRDL